MYIKNIVLRAFRPKKEEMARLKKKLRNICYLMVLERLSERRLGGQDLQAMWEKSEIDTKF